MMIIHKARSTTMLVAMSFLFLLLVNSADSRPPSDSLSRSYDSSASKPAIIDRASYIDANRIFSYVTNIGSFASDNVGQLNISGGGLIFPYAGLENIANGQANKTAVFAAGLWLGGIDSATGDTLVAVAVFSEEYVPGPMKDGSHQSDRPEFKVYKLYRDSLEGNPNSDYTNWPVDQGAPVDDFGKPEIHGAQTVWTVFNDADPNKHTTDAGQTAPMGVEVQQMFWAFDDSFGSDINAIYLRYTLINKGSKTLDSFYISLWFDPDLGGLTDDLVGSDPEDNVFFCYNATNADAVYGSRPPAFGGKLIEGPIVEAPGERAFVNGVAVDGYKNLGMSSCIEYVNGTDPDYSTESYRLITGLTRDGSPLIDPSNGEVTRFFGNGDPVAETGFLDTNPADKRMMASVGPITLAPADTQYVTYKLALGLGIDRLTSLSVLRFILNCLIDSDGDGALDCDDICPGYPDSLDSDNDGVPDGCDRCDGFDDSLDADSDGFPDGCDICSGFDDSLDEDGDSIPDGCDPCPANPASPCCCDIAGDADNNGEVNISDATKLICYLFSNCGIGCIDKANSDGSEEVDVGDAVYIVLYIFGSGFAPICGTTGQ